MAYDATRQRVVLFAGRDATDGGLLNDTWEWDGTSWQRRVASGPFARFGHAMAFDAARQRVVLFGGRDNSYRDYETWEWNGSNWTKRNIIGPTPRAHHALAYDSTRQRIVLVGGEATATLGATPYPSSDTWEFDGTRWEQKNSIDGPRYLHAAAYDPNRQVMVAFGGRRSVNQIYYGTEEWDGTSWSTPSVMGAGPVESHAMAYDSARSRVILFGGRNASREWIGLWEWDGLAWVEGAAGAPARVNHSMTFDSARRELVVFGGFSPDGGGSSETWTLAR